MSTELDIKVAEILGWTEIDRDECTGFAPWQTVKFGKHAIPEFSTNWEAAGSAWEWLEKSGSRGYQVVLTRNFDGHPCVAELAWDELVPVPYNENSESYPEAICKAIIWFDEWKRNNL